MPHLRFIAGLLCLPALAAAADLHRFVDQSGSILAADVVSMENGHVTLKTQDGRTLNLTLNQLSEVDQRYLREKFPAAPVNIGSISLEWKSSIGPNSGRAVKTKKSYTIAENQVLNLTLTNKGNQTLDNLQLGCRVYLCKEDGLVDPEEKSALRTLLRVNPIKPRETVVVETPPFNVSDVVTGPTPNLQITQEQRKRVKGIIAVLFQNDEPIFEVVTPGLEAVKQRIVIDKDGLAVPLRKLFPRDPKP